MKAIHVSALLCFVVSACSNTYTYVKDGNADALQDAARRNQGRVALQGNLDPAMLYGNPEAVRAQVRTTLDSYAAGNGGSRDGHVFNLGHGLSPDMNPEHVAALVDEVHAYSRR